MNQSQREYLLLESSFLEPGETRALDCCFCNAQHESKLYVTKTGLRSLLYMCHRAACGASGGIGGGHGIPNPTPTAKFVPRSYKGATQSLSLAQKHYFKEKYEIISTRGFYYEKSKNLLVFQLKTSTGTIWGTQTKLEWERPAGVPKSCLYAHRDVPKLHFESTTGKGTCAIVEDVISARKLSTIIPTVALLGTHLSEEGAIELRKSYDSVVLALDYDAVEKARKIKKKWSCLLDISIVILKEDVKDTPYVHLTEVFA